MDFDLCLKMFSPTFKEKIINIIKKAIQNEYIIAEKELIINILLVLLIVILS